MTGVKAAVLGTGLFGTTAGTVAIIETLPAAIQDGQVLGHLGALGIMGVVIVVLFKAVVKMYADVKKANDKFVELVGTNTEVIAKVDTNLDTNNHLLVELKDEIIRNKN